MHLQDFKNKIWSDLRGLQRVMIAHADERFSENIFESAEK